ncbi:major facilitator superfamily transporter [Apodospora peruviana]|uniref:Major facilitator superfamily transporter n=1 Tax=Apodospora peruviana TaxID=516989 RepID=A0AAE0I5B2_9PEZI|nr:major facilitator superfamily transporter [Apodospora peruviana]
MLDSSIVATSLFTIAAEFHEIGTINWVALAYTLAFLSCGVLFARVSDVVGRKAAFLAAYFIFIAFSLGCGFSQNLQQLIVCRAFQGIGGSGLYSLTMIIFPELASNDQKKIIAAFVGVVLAIAGVLGPVLGGILTEYASWRWVFWINGPVGSASALLFFLTWPDKKYLPLLERRAWKEVDFLGSFLLIASAVLIVFPFQDAGIESDQWSRADFLAPLILGIASFVALLAWQYYIDRRRSDKMAAAVPLILLRNGVYTATVLNTVCMGFPYLLSLYVFPTRFQVVNGKSALEAGLMMLPMLAGAAIGSTAAGALNGNRNRLFETLMAGCVLLIIGCAAETTVSDERPYEAKSLGFLVFIGLGFGFSATASTMLANIESTMREHASAQGIVAQVRILGGSIGIAASSAILGVNTRSELAGVLPAEQLSHLASVTSSLSPEQQGAVRHAYTSALREDMIVCCAVLALGTVCTLGAYRRNRLPIADQVREQHRQEEERRRAVRERQANNILP